MYKQLLTAAALLSIGNAINALSTMKEFGFSNMTDNDIVLRIDQRNERPRYQIIPSKTTVTQVSNESACLASLAWAPYSPAAGGSDLVDKPTLRISETNQKMFGDRFAMKYAFMPIQMKTRMSICKSSNFIIYDSGERNNMTQQPVLVAEIDQVARAN